MSDHKTADYKTEIRDGMAIDWDVPVTMNDGVVLRCDVFRPIEEGRYPVIMGAGPYGKQLHFGDGYSDQYNKMIEKHPDVTAGSTNKYQSFELCDPEKFVPHGYAVVRFDTRGTGTSEGTLIPWQYRETEDLVEIIDWCARQPWSDGNVGMSGISYLATNQWQVAQLKPPALKALCIWEGYNDFYREMCYHGGILSTFGRSWYTPFILPMQHGQGEDSYTSSMTGEPVTGPKKYTKEQLRERRIDWHEEVVKRPLATDRFWEERGSDLSKIDIPFLSTGNWGGQALHLRGNVEGFLEAPAKDKYLEFHCLEHWTEYYTAYGVDLQLRFFDQFLKNKGTWKKDMARVYMQVRHVDGTWSPRGEDEWPIARTRWTEMHLDADRVAASWQPAGKDASITYRGMESDGVTFMTPPLTGRTEITGPIAAKLFVSSATEDADLFVVVRVFRGDLKEVTFQGHTDPHVTIAQGWLRASHRKLDPKKTLPYRPYHTHDEIQKLTPGEIYELDIEVWPTCIVIEPGYRIAVTIRGKDYEYPGDVSSAVRMLGLFTGVGPFRHNSERNRPKEVFDNDVTLHTGPSHPAHLLLPVVPEK